eukprot:3655371-Pyramimonas_sp.AAC.1
MEAVGGAVELRAARPRLAASERQCARLGAVGLRRTESRQCWSAEGASPRDGRPAATGHRRRCRCGSGHSP